MIRDDGGSAFPQVSTSIQWSPSCEQYYDDTESWGGMSLRDFFAAKALQGDLAAFANPGYSVGTSEWTQETADRMARGAYTLADAMLRAREQQTEGEKPC